MTNEELSRELDTAKLALDVLWESKDSLATERDQLQTALSLATRERDKALLNIIGLQVTESAAVNELKATLARNLTLLAAAKERNQLKAELASMTKDRDQLKCIIRVGAENTAKHGELVIR